MDLKIDDISEGVINKFTNIVNRDTDDCILFESKIPSNRYPSQQLTSKRFGSKTFKAHRVSFVIFNGDLEEGDVVMHTCDNPHCINPKHLLKGTFKQNNHDCNLKGRRNSCINLYSYLGNIARRKMNDFSFDKVKEVRRLRREDNLSYTQLASIFNVSVSYIHYLCTFKTRKYE